MWSVIDDVTAKNAAWKGDDDDEDSGGNGCFARFIFSAVRRGGSSQLITRFVGRRKMPAVIKKTAATPGITTRLSWFREGCQT